MSCQCQWLIVFLEYQWGESDGMMDQSNRASDMHGSWRCDASVFVFVNQTTSTLLCQPCINDFQGRKATPSSSFGHSQNVFKKDHQVHHINRSYTYYHSIFFPLQNHGSTTAVVGHRKAKEEVVQTRTSCLATGLADGRSDVSRLILLGLITLASYYILVPV